jgi:deoxyribonuclease-4
MSIAGGTPKAIERGASIGCTAIQLFLKNANQWNAKPIRAEEAGEFRERMAAGPVRIAFAHDSYLVNLGSPSDALFDKSVGALTDEVERAAALGVPFVVLHPGAPIDRGEEFGLARISSGLTRVLDATKGAAVRLALENTAGQGSHLGYRFEQLGAMIQGASDSKRLGVCFDTCHAFAAGYDLRTPETYAETMRAFDDAVGLDRLLAIHLNDARKDLGSRVDRHEHIGQGMLGLEAFRQFMNDPRLAAVPKVLETPKGEDMKEDVENMGMLIGLVKSEE